MSPKRLRATVYTDSFAVSGVMFFVVKSKFLPRQQPDKMFRWEYDYTEIGDNQNEKGYTLANVEPGPDDADEWTVGSSSSISSGSRSPVDSDSLWEGETLASQSDNERSPV